MWNFFQKGFKKFFFFNLVKVLFFGISNHGNQWIWTFDQIEENFVLESTGGTLLKKNCPKKSSKTHFLRHISKKKTSLSGNFWKKKKSNEKFDKICEIRVLYAYFAGNTWVQCRQCIRDAGRPVEVNISQAPPEFTWPQRFFTRSASNIRQDYLPHFSTNYTVYIKRASAKNFRFTRQKL